MLIKFLDGTKKEFESLDYADLRGADLRGANLQCADLRGADLDFSCLPLWCGSFSMKVDIEFIKQLLYHIYRLDFDDTENIKDVIKPFAKTASVISRRALDWIL